MEEKGSSIVTTPVCHFYHFQYVKAEQRSLQSCSSLAKIKKDCSVNVTTFWMLFFSLFFFKRSFTFLLPRQPVGPTTHLYVTEDHSKCSFRLSAGGGPRHLAPVEGGGAPERALRLSSALISSDNEDNGPRWEQISSAESGDRGPAGELNRLLSPPVKCPEKILQHFIWPADK